MQSPCFLVDWLVSSGLSLLREGTAVVVWFGVFNLLFVCCSLFASGSFRWAIGGCAVRSVGRVGWVRLGGAVGRSVSVGFGSVGAFARRRPQPAANYSRSVCSVGWFVRLVRSPLLARSRQLIAIVG